MFSWESLCIGIKHYFFKKTPCNYGNFNSSKQPENFNPIYSNITEIITFFMITSFTDKYISSYCHTVNVYFLIIIVYIRHRMQDQNVFSHLLDIKD